MTTAKQRTNRKAQQKYRDNMKEAGFRQVPVWIPATPEAGDQLHAFTRQLRDAFAPGGVK